MRVKCLHIKCNAIFSSKSNKKYCSRKCKDAAKDLRRGDIVKRPYIAFKKNYCEYCGFIPLHTCQLDVDHIDGDHSNNLESNLQTLCANCHRLKTFNNKDWETS